MGRFWFARLLGVVVVLVLPAFGFSYGTLTFGGSGKGISIVHADDSNGDKHSNCHTGSKGLGAGGNDKGGCGIN